MIVPFGARRSRPVTHLAVLCCGLGTACDREPPLTPICRAGEAPTWAYTDVAIEAGVQDTWGRNRGISIVDFDGDDDLDVLTLNPGDPTFLYLNQGDGTFLAQKHAPTTEWTEAASPADIDGDGDLDLYLSCGGFGTTCRSRLWRNDGLNAGEVLFTDISEDAGVGLEPTAAFAGVWQDYDLDGDVDLFSAVKDLSTTGTCTCAGPGYSSETSEAPLPVGLPEWDPDARTSDFLYRNEGDGSFAQVAEASGLADPADNHTATWLDYDLDGWPDLYVPTLGGPNHLYHNEGDGRFVDVTTTTLAQPDYAFGSASADFNNDGLPDLFATAYLVYDPEYHGLFLNEAGSFTQAATVTGMQQVGTTTDAYWAMGVQIGDLDLNGYTDVYIGTGAPISQGGGPSYVFRTDPDPTNPFGIRLTDVSAIFNRPAPVDPEWASLWTEGPYRTHGVAIFDYDNDGDNDVMVGNGGFFDDQREPDHLWRNDTPCTWSWLKLRLRGPGLNTAAIGAELEVRDEDGWTVYRRHTLAGGFTSSQPDILHIGMGDHPGPYTVTVRWPTGEQDIFEDVPGEALTVLEAR